MNTILLNILDIFFLVILTTVLYLLLLWMWSNIRAKVPFVRIPNKVLKDIEKALNMKEDSVVYDLGCGDGRVLFYLYKNNPKATFIGIENSDFPALVARIHAWIHRKIYKSNIIIYKKDFFDVDISNATHIFTYLYPNVMDDLITKFDKELKRGTRLVSASFHFTSKKEVELIDLKRNKYQLGKLLYVYEF